MRKLLNQNLIRKNDILLIGFLLLITGALLIISSFTKKEGDYVKVSIHGVPFHSYLLNEDQEVTIVDLQMGQMTLSIENGFVSVTESACPDLICVNHRKISKMGESIICLPNRVVVEVVGENSNAPDSITR